jgi:hypothetical protein
MPLYRFALQGTFPIPDLEGTECSDDEGALSFGVQVIRELMDGDPDQYNGWCMEISEGQRIVASLSFGVDVISLGEAQRSQRCG